MPFGFRSYTDLVGVGPSFFWTKGLGIGLDNMLLSLDGRIRRWNNTHVVEITGTEHYTKFGSYKERI